MASANVAAVASRRPYFVAPTGELRGRGLEPASFGEVLGRLAERSSGARVAFVAGGRLADEERLQALEAATVVVVPSPYESLSLLALESFAVGTPVLANARSDVLVDHSVRSNAALYYADRDEFVECLKRLVSDQTLRQAMGRNGRAYVRRHYRWDVIMDKYERMLSRVRRTR